MHQMEIRKLIEDALRKNDPSIDMSSKNLQELTAEIERLKALAVRLGLSNNSLSQLPKEITLFSRLRYLNIRNNGFRQFPTVLCEMPNLEILDISRNKIGKLPHDFGRLMTLKVFSLAKNRLKYLPLYVARMENLQILKVEGNPLEFPPKQIVSVGSLAPHVWLNQLKEYIKQSAEGNFKERDKMFVEEAGVEAYFASRVMAHSFEPALEVTRNVTFAVASGVTVARTVVTLIKTPANEKRLVTQLSRANSKAAELVSALEEAKSFEMPRELMVDALQALKQLLLVLRVESQQITSQIDARVGKRVLMQLFEIAVNVKDAYELVVSHVPAANLLVATEHKRTPSVDSNAAKTLSFEDIRHQQLVEHAELASQHAMAALTSLEMYLDEANNLPRDFMATFNTAKDASNSLRSALKGSRGDFQVLSQESNSFAVAVTRLIQHIKEHSDSLTLTKPLIAAFQALTRSTKSLAVQLRQK